jgi:hypothetical protein
MSDIEATTIDTLKCVLSKFEVTPNTVFVVRPTEDNETPLLSWHSLIVGLVNVLSDGVPVVVLPKGSLWQALQPPDECSRGCKDGCADEYPVEYEWLLDWGYRCGWKDAMKAMRG